MVAITRTLSTPLLYSYSREQQLLRSSPTPFYLHTSPTI